MQDIGIDAWITIGTVLGMFSTLLLTKLRPDAVFLAAIGVLFATGVLDAKEACSGFSSTSVVVIGVLFIVVAGLMHTGVLQWIVRHLLGQPTSYRKAIVRMMLPVAGLSSFLSNTTVVAMFVGIVKMWSKKLDIAPSKLLIPLSYAAGMDGSGFVKTVSTGSGTLSSVSLACKQGFEVARRKIRMLSAERKGKKMRTLHVTILAAAGFCVAGVAEELDFKAPEIIPVPAKLTYEPSVAVRIEAATAFSVACPDESAAPWVKGKVKAWFGVEPSSVEAVISAGQGELGDEGYTLSAAPGRISIAANTAVGVKYAMQSLRQAAERESGGMTLRGWWLPALEIRDKPALKFRGVHFCWFPECSSKLIERLVRVAASYKFNYVVLENWGVFKSKRYPFLSLPDAPLDAAEAKRLVAVANDLGITIIPQVNIYGHAAFSRMIVGKHVALDYGPEHLPIFESYNGWNWCLSNPDARKVLKGFIEEVHEAFGNPPFFHIGCDEADPPSCPVCRAAKPYSALVEAHIKDVADLLRKRGARAMMWHDMLIEKGKWGQFYAHGSQDDAKMADTLPKDIVICDWYYGGAPEKKDGAVLYPTMDYFASKGFSVVTSPWHNEKGIDAQAEYVREKGYFGFLETVWHHYRGHKFALAMEQSACAAWGKRRARPWRQGGFAFSTHWRRCGWDMGASAYSEMGLWSSQIAPDAHDD